MLRSGHINSFRAPSFCLCTGVWEGALVGGMLWDVHITGFLVDPSVGKFWSRLPCQWKNGIVAIHTDIIEIHCTHDLPLLPQSEMKYKN